MPTWLTAGVWAWSLARRSSSRRLRGDRDRESVVIGVSMLAGKGVSLVAVEWHDR